MSDQNAPTPDAELLCPKWCCAQHGRETHPDDNRHESQIVTVPVVVLERVESPGGERLLRHPDTAEVFLALHQHLGESETWVALGLDGRGVDLTLESAQRVHLALGDLSALPSPDAP